MLYKLISETRIEPCPDVGIVGEQIVSNLPLYYADNPEKAVEQGYYPLSEGVEPEIVAGEVLLLKYALVDGEINTTYEIIEVEEEDNSSE